MTVVKKVRIVKQSCEQMYRLVNEVEHYPEFLPYCTRSTIHYRNEQEVQATLQIAASGFTKEFTTRNLLQPHKMVEIRLIEGPFKHLEGFWRFDEVSEGCQISFDLEFEFATKMLSMFLGPFFEQIANRMVDAFCERAEIVYAEN